MDAFEKEFLPLKKFLDASTLRHRVLTNNLANANTPNFHRSDVNFSDYMEKALSADDPKSLAALKAEVIPGKGTVKINGNNVDMDKEVGAMNQNMVLYRTITRFLSMKIDLIKTAITRTQ